MDNQQCKNCKHYLQHYILYGKSLYRICSGHCIFSKSKNKRPDAKACEKFIQIPSREEAFVKKEYLSKELLKYVLSLELLPEIEDWK